MMIVCERPWDDAPPQVTLRHDAVHVWCASLDQPVAGWQQALQTLSAGERWRAEKLYFEQDRQRFIVGHGLLRAILGRYLNMEPERMQFCYGPHGKPALQGTADRQVLTFNMSHSHGLALYAITRDRRIGVDIEHIRMVIEAEQIARGMFSPQEYAELRSLPPSELLRGFFTCWTRKEAYIKAQGDGLAYPLDQFTVSLLPREPAQLLNVQGDIRAPSSWSLCGLTPAPGYVAALAVEEPDVHLSCWQWKE